MKNRSNFKLVKMKAFTAAFLISVLSLVHCEKLGGSHHIRHGKPHHKIAGSRPSEYNDNSAIFDADKCAVDFFQCPGSRRCVSQFSVCNGKNDCLDWSVESSESCPCAANELRCIIGRTGQDVKGSCVPTETICNTSSVWNCWSSPLTNSKDITGPNCRSIVNILSHPTKGHQANLNEDYITPESDIHNPGFEFFIRNALQNYTSWIRANHLDPTEPNPRMNRVYLNKPLYNIYWNFRDEQMLGYSHKENTQSIGTIRIDMVRNWISLGFTMRGPISFQGNYTASGVIFNGKRFKASGDWSIVSTEGVRESYSFSFNVTEDGFVDIFKTPLRLSNVFIGAVDYTFNGLFKNSSTDVEKEIEHSMVEEYKTRFGKWYEDHLTGSLLHKYLKELFDETPLDDILQTTRPPSPTTTKIPTTTSTTTTTRSTSTTPPTPTTTTKITTSTSTTKATTTSPTSTPSSSVTTSKPVTTTSSGNVLIISKFSLANTVLVSFIVPSVLYFQMWLT